MPIIIQIACYLGSGVAGAVLVWVNHKVYRRRTVKIEWCPRPCDVLGWVLGSVFGPVIFLLAIVLSVIEWLHNMPDDHWFVSPICKDKD